MNKTALTQLYEEIEMAESLSSMNYLVSWDTVKALVKAKLPIEREQIENAFASGFHVTNKTSENYFNKTYEQ
jgi:UDP-N-acetylglucosamine transferase subunit ALG13